MKTRALAFVLLSFVIWAVLVPLSRTFDARPGDIPVYVTLWFDTEDYITPESDDAAKRLAEMLTRLKIKATFKLVGEKARVLEQRGRKDVIAALLRHEIGYHANTHSQQPTISVYLQNTGWDDGGVEFERREGPGVRDIQRIFGVTPSCYGQPGSAWAPQTYPALKRLGIKMYLDEGNHVGLDDQPFYYCGMLKVFRMKSMVARMELGRENHLAEAKAKFQKAYDRLRGQGGGTISIFYHPTEFLHREFWDGVNFARGANPPRERWQMPARRSEAEIENAFRDFEQYVTFIKQQPGVRYVTASELLDLYSDKALSKTFGASEIVSLAKTVQNGIAFQKLNGYALSGADIFSLLTTAFAYRVEKREWSNAIHVKQLYGPTRPFISSAGKARPSALPWQAWINTAPDVASYCQSHGRIPDEVWIGVERISPKDYLATLASVIVEWTASRQHPDQVTVRDGTLTTEGYVHDDSPNLWGWVIFPEGFHAPKIMELARLQAWTLKPALLQGH